MRRTLASALLCAATALLARGPLAAQAVPAQPHIYVLTSDAVDGRALWINPAGMARRVEASVGVYASAEDSAGWRLAQGGVQLAAQGFAFGWQRDGFGSAPDGNTYALGVGLGDARLALGAARRWYRRASGNDAGWDLGGHAAVLPFLDAAAVWRDIGSPQAGDSVLEETLALALSAAVGGRLRLSGEWQAATSGFVSRRTRAAVTLAPGGRISLHAVVDFASDPRLRGVALAVQLGLPNSRFALAARESDTGANRLVGISAMSVSRPGERRRFPRR